MRNHPLARQPAVYILANGKNEHSISALPLICRKEFGSTKTMSILMALLPDMMCMI